MGTSLIARHRFVVALLFGLSITACSTTPAPAPHPEAVYSQSGARKGNVESYDKFNAARVFEYSYDDVFEATRTAFFRKGFQIHTIDQGEGVILANGSLNRREMIGYQIPFTASAKIVVIDRKPNTQLTIHVDSYWDIFVGSAVKLNPSANHLGNELFADIQKILTTY